MTPRWVSRACLGLALAALAISTYLTIAHYSSPQVLACGENGVVDCALVTSSPQSSFLGIPVALLGLLWSAAVVALCLPLAWRARQRWVHIARYLLVVGGMAFVVWLVYAELFIIRKICLWCTVVHLITFALFVLVLLFASPDAQRTRSAR